MNSTNKDWINKVFHAYANSSIQLIYNLCHWRHLQNLKSIEISMKFKLDSSLWNKLHEWEEFVNKNLFAYL